MHHYSSLCERKCTHINGIKFVQLLTSKIWDISAISVKWNKLYLSRDVRKRVFWVRPGLTQTGLYSLRRKLES